jgi:starch phosphorylase
VLASAGAQCPAPEVKRLQEVLDPETFTIGFARRFATYKRATLFFRDRERLKRLLTNPRMPVQIVIAGSASVECSGQGADPRDRAVLARSGDGRAYYFRRGLWVQVAREMVQGVDVWLNNPKRGEEAAAPAA